MTMGDEGQEKKEQAQPQAAAPDAVELARQRVEDWESRRPEPQFVSPPETDAARSERESRSRASKGIAAIGDALSAIGNLYYTTRGGLPLGQYGHQHTAQGARWDKVDAANEKLWSDYRKRAAAAQEAYREAMSNWNKEGNTLYSTYLGALKDKASNDIAQGRLANEQAKQALAERQYNEVTVPNAENTRKNNDARAEAAVRNANTSALNAANNAYHYIPVGGGKTLSIPKNRMTPAVVGALYEEMIAAGGREAKGDPAGFDYFGNAVSWKQPSLDQMQSAVGVYVQDHWGQDYDPVIQHVKRLGGMNVQDDLSDPGTSAPDF